MATTLPIKIELMEKIKEIINVIRFIIILEIPSTLNFKIVFDLSYNNKKDANAKYIELNK